VHKRAAAGSGDLLRLVFFRVATAVVLDAADDKSR